MATYRINVTQTWTATEVVGPARVNLQNRHGLKEGIEYAVDQSTPAANEPGIMLLPTSVEPFPTHPVDLAEGETLYVRKSTSGTARSALVAVDA